MAQAPQFNPPGPKKVNTDKLARIAAHEAPAGLDEWALAGWVNQRWDQLPDTVTGKILRKARELRKENGMTPRKIMEADRGKMLEAATAVLIRKGLDHPMRTTYQLAVEEVGELMAETTFRDNVWQDAKAEARLLEEGQKRMEARAKYDPPDARNERGRRPRPGPIELNTRSVAEIDAEEGNGEGLLEAFEDPPELDREEKAFLKKEEASVQEELEKTRETARTHIPDPSLREEGMETNPLREQVAILAEQNGELAEWIQELNRRLTDAEARIHRMDYEKGRQARKGVDEIMRGGKMTAEKKAKFTIEAPGASAVLYVGTNGEHHLTIWARDQATFLQLSANLMDMMPTLLGNYVGEDEA